MMDRVILHCDLNSFYASVELLEHPELCNRPVAVCGDPESRHGIILAKNEPAKKYKVQTAETIWQARRKCPDLVLLPAHHWKYRAYSGKVNRIYERYTDLVEPFSIDESWLDVTGTLHLFGGNGKALADEIRRVVREELGLTLSVGVSFNKVFAKMGSDYKKPDATTLITRENFQQLLWPLPVTDLLFVGKAAANVLNGYGIRTIGDLARFDRDSLGRILGKGGYTLHDYATGREHAPVLPAREMPGPKSVGNGLTYPRNLTGWEELRTALSELADEVAARLRKHGLKATTLQLTIRDPSFKDICRQKRLSAPTYVSRDLTQAELDAGLVAETIAYDAVAVIVDEAAGVTELTLEQIAQIYAGEITNWSQVNGNDLDIRPIVREAGSGTRDCFNEALEGVYTPATDYDTIMAGYDSANSNGTMANSVSNFTGAIGYVGLSYLSGLGDGVVEIAVNGVKASVETTLDGSYDITRSLILVTNGEPDADEKALLDYMLSEAGQALVEEEGYVPVI